MQRWHGLESIPTGWGHCVVTIGVFDGIHRGHQSIIGEAVRLAAERRVPSVLITFVPHPSEVVRPGSHPAVLTTIVRRAELVEQLGVDVFCPLPFTLEFSRMAPDEFIHEALVDRLHASAVVVGENFRFGHRQAGDVAMLTELGEQMGFTVDAVPLLSGDDAPMSSTWIRGRLADGDVAAAARGLGRLHRVEGPVVRGNGRGKGLGYPTANVEVPEDAAVPADGVYAGWLVRADGARLPAAISIGTNPTFDGTERRVEAYALDVDLDLYGEHVAVDFAERLRGMVKFDDVEGLVEQMADDVRRTREVLVA